MVFDPFELDEDVTPATVRSAIAAEKFARALLVGWVGSHNTPHNKLFNLLTKEPPHSWPFI